MELTWSREDAPVWDGDKKRIIGGAPEGAFVLPWKDGEALPGDWFTARDQSGRVVGYGRLDTTWGGDAEILLAVDPSAQQSGIGSYVLGKLESEADARGINYVYNTIRDADPQRDQVHDWLVVRGFDGSIDSVLRKRVGSAPTTTARSAPHVTEVYDASADAGSQPPGHEEAGGYVNVEDHRF